MNYPSTRTYWIIGFGLLLLLALTIMAAGIDLGPFNTVIAMLISVAKATLVALFFMHLSSSKPLLWVFAGAGLFWLGIMFALALSDYLTRGWS